jgi:hypothetical protein
MDLTYSTTAHILKDDEEHMMKKYILKLAQMHTEKLEQWMTEK